MAEKEQCASPEELMDTFKRKQIVEWRLFLSFLFADIGDNKSYRGREVRDLMRSMWDLAIFAAKEQRLDEFDKMIREIWPKHNEEKDQDRETRIPPPGIKGFKYLNEYLNKQ